MIDHTIVPGTKVGIKLYLRQASTSKPDMLYLSKALEEAASRFVNTVTFDEGRKIAVGEVGDIKDCTKAVFFPLKIRTHENKDLDQKLLQIAEELLMLSRVLIKSVVGAQVVRVEIRETGGQLMPTRDK